MSTSVERAQLWRRQALVLLLLFGGYASCYFGRADFSVTLPLLADELVVRGWTHTDAVLRLGEVYSAGVLAYALGKFFLGGIGDIVGGRRALLLALGGAAACTWLFALDVSLPLFTVAWVGNRLLQSVGWAGVLKVTGRWFDYRSHGTVVGLLSVSYLVGDALARQSMGSMLDHGASWSAVFRWAAVVLAVAFVLNAALLRESRTVYGHSPAETHPLNLYTAAGTEQSSLRFRDRLRTLLASRSFRMVCVLSFGCTVVREVFNVWTPVFLNEAAGYATADAASLSAVFPGVGALSVLLTGWCSDRMGPTGRPQLLVIGLLLTAALLLVLWQVHPGGHWRWLTVALIGGVAFTLLGPYSTLGGAFALDFGGGTAGAMASGIIDGIGYLGGTLAGAGVARLGLMTGWKGVFVALALVASASALAAVGLYRAQQRADHPRREACV